MHVKRYLMLLTIFLQSLSCVRLFATPWTAACQASKSLTIFWCPSSWFCHSTISSSFITFSSRLQSFPASGSFLMSQLFTSDGKSIGASASASNEYSGLISFRTDWLDLLAVQGTLQSLLQHHSSKTSISMLSLPYCLTLTSTHDYWRNQSFDYTHLCW